jgi:hypothetical protein
MGAVPAAATRRPPALLQGFPRDSDNDTAVWSGELASSQRPLRRRQVLRVEALAVCQVALTQPGIGWNAAEGALFCSGAGPGPPGAVQRP